MIKWGVEVPMPAPLSNDIRERVVLYRQKYGGTYEYIAEALGVGRASVSRILRLHRESGGVEPKPATGGYDSRLNEAAVDELIAMLEAEPDLTLERLADRWAEEHPELACSRQTVGRLVRKRGYTRKKSRSAPKNATEPPSLQSARRSRSG
ncbi:MAG: transposase [Myxococcales bacterium]|nr:transposase [Myxococcales bacterium]